MCCCDEHRCDDAGKYGPPPEITLKEQLRKIEVMEWFAGIVPSNDPIPPFIINPSITTLEFLDHVQPGHNLYVHEDEELTGTDQDNLYVLDNE
jgi:hypothetical protein